ncbi:MAG: inositol monophosphatase family protein [Candidatus Latescibacterota bacterium]|nr:inositol monophosphatase family protein [Candidatus Latescibacterota bacterium]
MSESVRTDMEFAADAAWRAGRVTLRYFQTGVTVERKEDDSPVTVADREAESCIRELVARAYPQDGLVGEEFGEQAGRSGRRWFIDPIDGTKSFVQGVPLYGVLIGLQAASGMVTAGAVYFPGMDELVYAGRDEGCWWNGRPCRVSEVSTLREACVCYTSQPSFAEEGKHDVWTAISKRAKVVRGWGDCYGHILVATGRAEAMFDPVISPWDCGPLPVILGEAGGTFTDWKGESTLFGDDAFSTNGYLFDEVRRHLSH